MWTMFAILLTVGCAGLSIGLYKSIPLEVTVFKRWKIPLRLAIKRYKLLGAIANYLLSRVLLQFIGMGMLSGLANLCGSMIFALYLFLEDPLDKLFARFKRAS